MMTIPSTPTIAVGFFMRRPQIRTLPAMLVLETRIDVPTPIPALRGPSGSALIYPTPSYNKEVRWPGRFAPCPPKSG